MKHEPSKREIAFTKFFLHTPAKTIYRSFADSISLQGHEKVLDFGSGYGTVAKWVAPRLTSGQLTCADISSIWQAECRNHLAKYKNITYFNDDIYHLDPSEQFDIIYAHFVLHDLPYPELKKVISHLIKLLKIGGKLYIREPVSDRNKFHTICKLLLQQKLQVLQTNQHLIPLMGTSFDIHYQKRALNHFNAPHTPPKSGQTGPG